MDFRLRSREHLRTTAQAIEDYKLAFSACLVEFPLLLLVPGWYPPCGAPLHSPGN